ncbi:3-hydroxyacyl-CoA dehydrogenase family protein [Paeniglutamicibacter sp. ABSL32-1]|uniref:3-hydroxyacyl-CoA dehydrogenase family protein n=1 Tax=Paeniglutamicibacter quisquiliarum TaxID=2849498 RepID=UPI001C2CEF67|nr:3-hydroxyacyl-CoA dehydrogenase family protein [Paeniglutamicibacter quisquiliarum]MBV1777695.1 3-hydroxyacyl-CoA dehydrogenase family protein [Paeniglutamicibacter quisquiliarum]
MGIFADRFGKEVVVVGAGTMGSGIAETFVGHGWAVKLVDPSTETLERATERIAAAGGSGSLITACDVAELGGARFVIETVPENPGLKTAVLSAVERLLKPELLCTNTSSLSVGELQSVLEHPDRFIGLHFFQPVPRTKLIEIVTTSRTSPETLQFARACAEELGRKPIVVADSPGFATSRLGIAIGLEAIRMVEEDIASASDIDDGMILGYQHGVGPLRMTDMVGLDTRLAIGEHLAATLGPRFEPPALLRKMVDQGKLGRKSGQGFFSWPEEK